MSELNSRRPLHRIKLPLAIKLWLVQAVVVGALAFSISWRLLPGRWEVPFLILATPVEILFMFVMMRWSRRVRRIRRGLCPACGYDVRATPERCPECGSDPAK